MSLLVNLPLDPEFDFSSSLLNCSLIFTLCVANSWGRMTESRPELTLLERGGELVASLVLNKEERGVPENRPTKPNSGWSSFGASSIGTVAYNRRGTRFVCVTMIGHLHQVREKYTSEVRHAPGGEID